MLLKTHGIHIHGKFYLNGYKCTLSPFRDEKPLILLHSQLQHSLVASPSSVEINLYAGGQQQNLPYSMVPKPFLYSNALMVKLYAQTLSFQSGTDKQINRLWVQILLGAKTA